MFKIVIIENQQTQFIKIVDNLKKSELRCQIKCETIEEYLEFINEVKIFLNPRYKYGKSRKYENAFAKIIEVVRDCDVLVIDHKLSGMHVGNTGIVLAKEIYTKLKYKIPIIFLSRTNRNDEKVKEQLDEFIHCFKNIDSPVKENNDWIWVEKGYFDGVLLDPEYFYRYVVVGIKKLIRENQLIPYVSKLLAYEYDIYRSKALLNTFKNNLRQILETEDVEKLEKVWEKLKEFPDPICNIKKKHIEDFNDQYSNL